MAITSRQTRYVGKTYDFSFSGTDDFLHNIPPVKYPSTDNIMPHIQLHIAIDNYDLNHVLDILNKYPDIDMNGHDEHGFTPLQRATFHGYESIVIELIRFGARVNLLTRYTKGVALHIAAFMGHDNIVRILIDNGAKLNIPDRDYSMAIHYAAYNVHIDIVKQLIDHKASLNVYDYDYYTPLHWAAQRTCLDLIVLLLEAGAPVNALDIDNNTPLHHAVLNSYDITRLLLDHGADITKRNKLNLTAADRAIRFGHGFELNAKLIDHYDLCRMQYGPTYKSYDWNMENKLTAQFKDFYGVA